MWSYLGRRLFQALITILVVTMICFSLARLSSDPMAQYANKPGLTQEDKNRIRLSLGLDRTIPVEWVHWMKRLWKPPASRSNISHGWVWL
jgi:peptide/nickel transport system permease protein